MNAPQLYGRNSTDCLDVLWTPYLLQPRPGRGVLEQDTEEDMVGHCRALFSHSLRPLSSHTPQLHYSLQNMAPILGCQIPTRFFAGEDHRLQLRMVLRIKDIRGGDNHSKRQGRPGSHRSRQCRSQLAGFSGVQRLATLTSSFPSFKELALADSLPDSATLGSSPIEWWCETTDTTIKSPQTPRGRSFPVFCRRQ
ncbi:hypothetical protein BKA57DRAFT_288676 [Linnemannia elongata]|nr:hypothetical protein BKA57DRAFT_288676 [Linnemannia elongata]